MSLTPFWVCPIILFVKNSQNKQRPHAFFKILFLILPFFLFPACASDPKKPSPVVGQVSSVQKTLNQLSQAYEKKDETAFLEKLDPDSKLLDAVRAGVLEDFKQFSKADLSFVIDRVEIDEESFQTMVHWLGGWKRSSSPPVEKRGDAVFYWIGREDPKLTEIRGDSPFGLFARTQ